MMGCDGKPPTSGPVRARCKLPTVPVDLEHFSAGTPNRIVEPVEDNRSTTPWVDGQPGARRVVDRGPSREPPLTVRLVRNDTNLANLGVDGHGDGIGVVEGEDL